MAAARSEAPSSTFSEEQRAELSTLIAEAVGSVGAPPADVQDAGKKEVPKVSDSEWAGMSDRQRQGWVESMVTHHLSELARQDKDYERDRKIAELEGRKAPEPEKAPSVWTRLQGLLWGEPDAR